MSLDDKDKKFIKDTINDSVKQNVDSQMAKTTGQLKRETFSRRQEEIKQRKQYLDELRQLQNEGQTTLAQKFELLKEEVNDRIPQDFKDTLKDMSNTMKSGGQLMGSGANKMTSGMDGILTRIMSINPVLAALYAGTKGVSKDLWNIGSGAVQAGVGGAQWLYGAAKGVGGAAAGILNNATNNIVQKVKDSKKKKEDVEEQLPNIKIEQAPEETELEIPQMFGEESQAEKMSKFSEEMENKINDIHSIVTKEQKGQAKELSQGLGGMQKTMDAIKQVTDVLQAKQKLIVAGVVLGALAIVGLAAWFKNGGFAALLDKLNPKKVIDDSFNNRQTNQEHHFNTAGQTLALTNLTGQQQKDIFTARKGYLTGIKDTNVSEHKNEYGKVDSKTYDYSVGKFTPVLAPYKGKCNKLNVLTKIKDGKAESMEWVMEISPYENKKSPLKLEHIISPQVKPGHEFEKGDILAYATEKFSMKASNLTQWVDQNEIMENTLGGYQDMVNEAKENNFKDSLDRLAQTKDEKKTDQVMDHVYHKLDASYKNMKNDKEMIAAGAETLYDITHKGSITRDRVDVGVSAGTTELIKDITGTTPITKKTNTDQGVATGGAANIQSENEQKAQEQNQQLKQSTQPQPAPTNSKGYNGELPKLGNISMEAPKNKEQDTYPDNVPTMLLDQVLPSGRSLNN